MSARSASASSKVALGRYTVYGEIASGGMATIQYGRLIGPGGFSRAVAIKRLHPQFAKDQSFVAMFLDEARLSARIAHSNVVQTLDIVAEPGELSVVMDYVHGESLARLLERVQTTGTAIPVDVAVTMMVGVLHGLHAAHETHGEDGEPLHIVHRDVSPENILVGSDGVARLLDFGIARAQGRSRVTPAGELKGKLAYMAVEQYRGQEADRRVDVYGASVVLWEALTGRDLFHGENDAAVVSAVMTDKVLPPSAHVPSIPKALDDIVLRGLSRDRELRFATAREMALALEHEIGIISQSRVSDWLEQVAGDILRARADMLRQLQQQAEPEPNLDRAGATRRLQSTPAPFEVRAGASLEPEASAPPAARPGRGHASSGLRTVKRTGRQLLLALLAVCVGVAAGVWWLARQRTEAPLASPPAAPAAEPTPPAIVPAQPAVAPTSGSTATAPEPANPAPPVTEERPAAVAPAPPAPPAEGIRREPARTPGRPRAKDKRAVDCENPFMVDAIGIRHVKRECLD